MNEIELKLAIAPADHLRFLRHPLLRDASARTDQILDNAYYDTPDLALRDKGVALRIRRQGRQRLQTVKLAASANAASAGLTVRPEWETPYRGRFDFSPVSAADIRRWLEQPSIIDNIGPLFRTRFRRVTWHLPLAGGGEVLVALDRGTIHAGGREEAISEVELELSGSEDVTALQTLAAKLAARIPLTPAALSKAQRAYNLMKQGNRWT